MTHPQPDDLADLAMDGFDGDPTVREHVAGCASCARLLEQLSSILKSATTAEALVPAPAGVRGRVFAEITQGDVSDHRDDVAGEASTVVPLAAPRRRRGVPWWAAGIAAAVALLAGLGIGRMTAVDPPAPEAVDRGTVIAAADLTALDSDAPRGTAQEVRTEDSVTLRVSARELGGGGGFHEVWLLNVDGTRMVALGVLADWDMGEFVVPQGLLDAGYRIVDISVEPDDGDPTHSGVSLARGELA